jgi:hypothetical protein
VLLRFQYHPAQVKGIARAQHHSSFKKSHHTDCRMQRCVALLEAVLLLLGRKAEGHLQLLVPALTKVGDALQPCNINIKPCLLMAWMPTGGMTLLAVYTLNHIIVKGL